MSSVFVLEMGADHQDEYHVYGIFSTSQLAIDAADELYESLENSEREYLIIVVAERELDELNSRSITIYEL